MMIVHSKKLKALLDHMQTLTKPVPLGTKPRRFKMAKRAFGVEVCFKGDTMTLEQLFGSKPIMSTKMSQLIWGHIREKQIEAQKDWKPKLGETVKAKFTNGKWYKATINKANGTKFTVSDEKDTWKVGRNELLKG